MKLLRYAAIWVLTISSSSIFATAEGFQIYRPYDHQYSQIIHAKDFETIRAIQTFGFKARHFESKTGVLISNREIKFTGDTVSEFSLQLEDDYVILDGEQFTHPDVLIFFNTMFNILENNSGVDKSFGIRADYWRSDDYTNITEILISFGSYVLFIGENSSGRDNPDRQYILDVVPEESTQY